MRILVDTQVFIWLINGDERLGVKSTKLLSLNSNRLLVSYFSFLEMSIKASIGKLEFDASIMDDLPQMGISIVMPDLEVLRKYKVFHPSNKDPFDNLILATAMSQKLVLITSDRKILESGISGLKILDARE